MEIPAATLDQVKRGKDGKLVAIDNDVCGIASDLKQIDPNLKLRYSEAGEYFVVYHVNPFTEREDLVTTAQVLDKRLVNKVRYLASDGYDFAKEIEKADAKADADQEHKRKEQTGEIAERLHHAVRKDLGIKTRISIPRAP